MARLSEGRMNSTKKKRRFAEESQQRFTKYLDIFNFSKMHLAFFTFIYISLVYSIKRYFKQLLNYSEHLYHRIRNVSR